MGASKHMAVKIADGSSVPQMTVRAPGVSAMTGGIVGTTTAAQAALWSAA